jgi:hypothetical protein
MAGPEIRCVFTADGARVHEFAVPLDASLDTPAHPLGAIAAVLEGFKLTANAFMTTRVEADVAASGGLAADDGWHELNDEGGGGESEEEEEPKAKRKANEKQKQKPKQGK